MPCATLFAPASMLLAVLLAVLPLIMPLSSAGGTVLPHAATVQAVRDPESSRIIHLRQSDLPLAAMPALSTATNVSGGAALEVARLAAAAPSGRAVPIARPEMAVSSRGSSAAAEARTAPAPVQTSRKSAVRSLGPRFRLIWPSQGT